MGIIFITLKFSGIPVLFCYYIHTSQWSSGLSNIVYLARFSFSSFWTTNPRAVSICTSSPQLVVCASHQTIFDAQPRLLDLHTFIGNSYNTAHHLRRGNNDPDASVCSCTIEGTTHILLYFSFHRKIRNGR